MINGFVEAPAGGSIQEEDCLSLESAQLREAGGEFDEHAYSEDGSVTIDTDEDEYIPRLRFHHINNQ